MTTTPIRDELTASLEGGIHSREVEVADLDRQIGELQAKRDGLQALVDEARSLLAHHGQAAT